MSNNIKTGLTSFALAMFVATVSSQANAAGFALIENGGSGQGNAYAGAAAVASDASTVWFNPAGMMKLKDDQIAIAGHFIAPESSFTNNGSVTNISVGGAPLTGTNDDGGSNAFTGNFYYVTEIDNKIKFGFGMNSPFGLKTEYDPNWVGRYHAIESDLKTLNFNPSIAFAVSDNLSVGLGINFMIADVTLTSAVDLGSLCFALPTGGAVACAGAGVSPQGNDGFGNLTGDNFDDVATGVNFGILYDLSDDTRLGVAYRSKVTINVDGDADFTVPASIAPFTTPLGVFADTGLLAKVTLPDSLSISATHDMDGLNLLGDITWIGWSSFDELRIVYDNIAQSNTVTTEDWDNTVRVSVGADYKHSSSMTYRAGIAYDQTPVPSAERRTPRIPDNDRRWLSLGLTYTMNTDMTLDVGYSHLFISDTNINNTLESSIPTVNATLTGTYDSTVDILSVQFNWKLN